MNYNIISEYVDFIKREFLNFFKIIFKDNYKRNLCLPLLDKYIEVRYYDETNYPNEKDFIKRLNKELIDVFEEIVNEENVEDLKNIVALFGYVAYLDDISITINNLEVIEALVNDENIKGIDKELKSELKTWYINIKKTKEKFNDTLVSKEFNLLEKKLGRRLYYLTLEHNVKISNLYSEYAIDKAYNTGIINEDKLFITYILASLVVLNNSINLDFSNRYMVPITNTLFEKEKKFQRLLNILDNPLSKKNILIRLTYGDYKNYKSIINKLINLGYSFGLELNDNYDGSINELILFPYILVKKDSNTYDMLLKEKEHLSSKIIKL